MSYRVIKVGGSLFKHPDLPIRLNQWLASLELSSNILIAGGGELVDVVRNWDSRFSLGQQTSHGLACQALRVTSTLLASWIDGAKIVKQIPLDATDVDSDMIIFDPSDWVLQQRDVDASWEFTSDSIAAKVAIESCADELLLLKAEPPESRALSKAIQQAYVDECFANYAQTVGTVAACTLDGRRVDFEFDMTNTDHKV